MLASVVDLTVRYIMVSSAKSRTLPLTESGRSFIYARKRHGVMDPTLTFAITNWVRRRSLAYLPVIDAPITCV